jgi:hypothetical protein
MLKDLSWECIESHWVVKTKLYELEELEDVWNFQCRTIPAPIFVLQMCYIGVRGIPSGLRYDPYPCRTKSCFQASDP